MTPKQALFVREYLIDRNATQAAIRAGYSEKTAKAQGSRLLTFEDVSASVREKTQETAEKLNISREWILTKLKGNAERALQDANDRYNGAAANKALELLGKHLGMFTDKIDHTHSGEVTVRFERETNKRTAS